MATHVYVDGFNLYYGCLKRGPHKWLNLESFCARLLPKDTVTAIRYFTAQVAGRAGDPQAPNRQLTYMRALATCPTVTVHLGQFKVTTTRMALAKPPAVGARTVEVIKTEEKGSDVNLASHLLLDGFRGRYTTAVVISNDSDLVEPVRLVRQELGLQIGIVNPHPANRRSRELATYATFIKQVRTSVLAACQFPENMSDARGSFRKPGGW